jgi:hypothetical protein
MVHDHRVRGLLGMQLELLRKLDADSLRTQKCHEFAPVVQIRACRIAEGVSGDAIGLVADHLLHRTVIGREAKNGPDPSVPHIGQSLGQLNTEPVQLQIVAVGVLLEQARGHLGYL